MAKVITIFSTKGGVGKTLLAANLAVSLAKDQNKKVCLIDLDLQVVGDMARILNMSAQKTIADLGYALRKHPQNTDKKDFILSGSWGIDFLAGVLRPQQSPYIDAKVIKDVFEFLRPDYDYIVVDAGKSFSEIFVATLNEANLMLLVVTPDILSIYQTKWVLDTLQFLHFPLSMIKVALNRADSLSSISWQEIRVNLPVDIVAQVPSEGKVVGLAVNRSVPVVIDSSRTKISQAIKKLARDLVLEEELFTEHAKIDALRLKETPVERGGEFWQDQNLADKPEEPKIKEEEMDEILLLKRRIHNRLIEELNIKRMDLAVFSDANKTKELKNRAEVLVSNLLVQEAGAFISSSEIRKKLVKEIIDEALGLGPLEDLLADPEITDIMVNNKDEIYIEKNGKIEITSKKFISNEQLKTIIERIIAPIGRRIDESVPMVDARLSDGSRINAIIPPLSLTGPALTIRKFKKEIFKVEELIRIGTLNQPMADFIRACVLARKNIIISGGTGSGKTTILNILSEFIPNNERIVTIEDAAELRLRQEHWVRLEARTPNIEGKGAVTIKDLFRNTLRMRPDRVIVGECRGVETLDMLQAMNTGHDGSMTTVHANSTRDVLARLDSMILMSGIELPMRAIREMIASAVHLIIHTARLIDGTRKIMAVTEVTGMKDEMHIDLRDIFLFKQLGVEPSGKVIGEFKAAGYIPNFIDEIKSKGIPISTDIFTAK